MSRPDRQARLATKPALMALEGRRLLAAGVLGRSTAVPVGLIAPQATTAPIVRLRPPVAAIEVQPARPGTVGGVASLQRLAARPTGAAASPVARYSAAPAVTTARVAIPSASARAAGPVVSYARATTTTTPAAGGTVRAVAVPSGLASASAVVATPGLTTTPRRYLGRGL